MHFILCPDEVAEMRQHSVGFHALLFPPAQDVANTLLDNTHRESHLHNARGDRIALEAFTRMCVYIIY